MPLALAALLLLPLLGFLFNFLLGKSAGKGMVAIVGPGVVLINFGIVLWFFSQLISNDWTETAVSYLPWMQAGNLQLSFSFLVDRLSVMMLLIITGIGFLIHVYSVGYMKHDEGYHRFFAYLNLFIFFMQVLVLGANYPILFIGWEGVGLCSFLLIGFWYSNPDYVAAAKKAFIMNRIGDLGLLLGMFLLWQQTGSLNYSDILNEATLMGVAPGILTAISLLMFVGATGKSAQIPLYTWLPDAMAGPTPVSALIHAATMVTAGIYLIVRSHVLFELSPEVVQQVILIIGTATALIAASIGLAQNDIKKVLAYSTVSQLGFMFIALGVGAYATAMFHLMTHAFFKALLFLGAGSVIHAMGDEQDIRYMGGLKKHMPTTFWTFLVATLAISGIPFFSGFFSKDEILAHAFAGSPIVWGIGLVASLLTALYMFRLLFLVFYGKFRGTEDQEHHLHESPATMTIPLVILGILSAIGGFLGIPHVIEGVPHLLGQYLDPILADIAPPHGEGHEMDVATELVLMGISALIAIAAIFIARAIFTKNVRTPEHDEAPSGFMRVLANKYYVDELYDAVIVRPVQWLSKGIYQILEIGVIDGIVRGVGTATRGVGNMLSWIQTGNIGFYLFAMVIAVVLLLFLNQFMSL